MLLTAFNSNMKYNELEEYISPDEGSPTESPIEDTNNNCNEEHGKKKWKFVEKYLNKEDVLQLVKEKKVWSFLRSYTTYDGIKDIYRCNLVKRRGKQCNASLMLLYHAEDMSVSIFETINAHSHDKMDNSNKNGIVEATKEIIHNIYKMGVTVPKMILTHIEEENKNDPSVHIPKLQQLYNYLKQYKMKANGIGRTDINFAELFKWCQEHCDIPIDEDQGFVVLYQIKVDEDEANDENMSIIIGDQQFRIFISSKRLLKLSSNAKIIQADSTYKVMWKGFPVIIIGFSDSNNVFHPIGMAITSEEKTADYQFVFHGLQYGLARLEIEKLENVTLLADNAKAITRGFRYIFGDTKRSMCWFHMRKSIIEQLTKIDNKALEVEVLIDIDNLQCCAFESVFIYAYKALDKKWSQKKLWTILGNTFLKIGLTSIMGGTKDT